MARNQHSKAGQGGTSAPISTHPAFPYIVALWFAALLGIGSFVVPLPLVEAAVGKTGIAAIFPPAAPPLGLTARIAIALAATCGGAIAGLLIARRVGRAHREELAAPIARTVAEARRPIAAHDELGVDGLDGGSARGRRALAITDENRPSDFLELAPLPGSPLLDRKQKANPPTLDLGEWDIADELAEELVEEADEAADEAADGDADHSDPPMPAEADCEAADDTIFELVEGELGALSEPERQQFCAPATAPATEPVRAEVPTFSVPSPPDHAAIADEAGADAAEAAAAPAVLEPQVFQPATPALQDACDPQPGEPDLAPDPDEQEASIAMTDRPQTDWREAPLDDLGLVQLAQRLGQSIEQRRAARAARLAAQVRQEPSPPLPVVSAEDFADDFMAAPADEAAQAMAAYFAAPLTEVPADSPPAEDVPAEEPAAVDVPAPASEPAAEAPVSRQEFKPIPAPAEPAAWQPLPGLARVEIDQEGGWEGEDDRFGDDFGQDLEQLAASFSLPLGSMVAPAPVTSSLPMPMAGGAREPHRDAGDQAGETNPFANAASPYVRIEDEPLPEDGLVEPAVVFPGEDAPDTVPVARPFDPPGATATAFAEDPGAPRPSTEDTERALRDALLGLQRMSGTG